MQSLDQDQCVSPNVGQHHALPTSFEKWIVVAFHRPYRMRQYQFDAGEYGFTFVRWTLSAIAIVIVSAAMFVGFEISSIVHGWM